MKDPSTIIQLTPRIEERIRKNPLLNMDTFIIPSPFVRDIDLEKDYEHSFVWIEEREILGYILVYSDLNRNVYHIYKLVTSPFGRGRGIGQAFIKQLAASVPENSRIYLYLWEKQTDTLEFFKAVGFNIGDTIVYRNLIYYHIFARSTELLKDKKIPVQDGHVAMEIGKTRHDARKIIRLLSYMVDTLSVENCDRIVEDINRETTTLINMLNIFRDSRRIYHEVNLRDLILERIVPYVQASPIKCLLQIKLNTKNTVVLGYHENIGRALVNIVSNSLDAIEEKGIKGAIKISLAERNDEIILSINDNGIGIEQGLLRRGENGLPLFVGRTTKHRLSGEGMGSVQIFSVFGPENISIRSSGQGTSWKIRFSQTGSGTDQRFATLQRRFHEFRDLTRKPVLARGFNRTDVISYIWSLRKMEIFVFDLVLMFSTYNNIRTVYRTVLSFIEGSVTDEAFHEFVFGIKSQNEMLNHWLFDMAGWIRERNGYMTKKIDDIENYRGALLKSYGQAVSNVIIFTLDPETGNFLASDRKLAEHLDFIPYLNRDRDQLLRGEFTGDLNNDSKPIFLGVWSINSDEDLINKLKLIRKAAAKLIEIGIHREKTLAFYPTTYSNHIRDIDSDKSTTFEIFASLPDDELNRFTRKSDSSEYDFLMQVD